MEKLLEDAVKKADQKKKKDGSKGSSG
jgi:hypothetical protein